MKDIWDLLRTWSGSFTTPLSEALKEAFRVTLFSLPGELILLLTNNKEINEKVLFINLILIFLRAMDKYLYEKSKNKGLEAGETRGGLSPI